MTWVLFLFPLFPHSTFPIFIAHSFIFEVSNPRMQFRKLCKTADNLLVFQFRANDFAIYVYLKAALWSTRPACLCWWSKNRCIPLTHALSYFNVHCQFIIVLNACIHSICLKPNPWTNGQKNQYVCPLDRIHCVRRSICHRQLCWSIDAIASKQQKQGCARNLICAHDDLINCKMNSVAMQYTN